MTRTADNKTWLHDKNWMVYRVLKRDNVIGTNPGSSEAVSSKLKLTFPNLFDALFHGYSPAAIYEIETASFNGHEPTTNVITGIARVD